MRFGAYAAADGAGAYAYYPGSTAGGITGSSSNAGDVWYNNNSYGVGSYNFASFNAFAVMHEVGHAIGLAHPGDYNAGVGASITYANDAQFIEDSQQYTIMSYFDETYTGVSGGLGFPDTFMLYDFMAIQQLYGADANYNAGDTVYGFNASEAGSVYDFTAKTTPFMTVYDGQGTDTIDLSAYAMGQFQTLEESVFSNVGSYTGNFSIAFGAVVENAVGGSGSDTITGGAGNDDIVDGGADYDLLIDGDGNDTYSGGDGVHTVEFSANADEFVFSPKEDGKISIERAIYKDEIDASVEFIKFSDQTFDFATVLANAGDIPVSLTDLYGEFMSVQMSSQHASIYGGETLLDGDATSFAQTGNGTDEWISLNLEVTRIQLTNSDSSGNRFDGAVVSLLDADGDVVHTFDPITGAENGEVFNLVLDAATSTRVLYVDGVSDQ